MLLFFARHYYSSWCTLFNTITPCLTLLFFFLLLACRCYSFCCFLVNVIIPLVAPCSTLLFILLPLVWCCYSFWCPLFNVVTPCSTLLLLLMPLTQRCYSLLRLLLILLLLLLPFLVRHCYSLLFGQHYYFYVCLYVPFCYIVMLLFLYSLFDFIVVPPSISNWYSPPPFFLQLWEELSKFKFQARLGRWEFFFNLCLLMNFFCYPCCFQEILVDNVFVCCVQDSFGHYTFNYTHCISFA